MALAPLPFGSDEPVEVAFWCIVVGVALVFAPVRGLRTGQVALVALGTVVVTGYAVVLHEQLAEHPWLPGAVPHPIWRQAQDALEVPLVPVVSIARNQPWFELGRPLLCVLAICCGFLVGADEGRARQLLKVVAWSGAVYAAYGIISHLFDHTQILWVEKRAYLESVTSTFINRNTAGAYFGTCAVVWSLLLWQHVRRRMPPGPLEWREVPGRLFSAPPKDVVLSFAMLFLCLAALFMTGSRGAVVLSLLALVVGFVAYFRRHLSRRGGLFTGIASCGAVVLILLQFMGSGVNARFDAQGLADEGRLETYKSTLRMIADHPWFGTGQGTFAYAFPAYRSSNASIWGVWDMAHNTPLQIASDMGVPIAGLVVVGWVIIFAVLIEGLRERRGGLVVPVTGLAVGLLGVLHSFIDFSLQIPGYSIVALSLVGAGLAQSFPKLNPHPVVEQCLEKSSEFGGLKGRCRRPKLLAGVARPLFAALGVLAVIWGLSVFQSSYQQGWVGRTADKIIAGEIFRPEALHASLMKLAATRSADQCRPTVTRGSALMRLRLMEIGLTNGRQPTDTELQFVDDLVRKSLSCSPSDPFLWLVLYNIELARNGFRPEYLTYLRLSYQLGPNEGWITLKRSYLLLSQFKWLSSDLREQAIDEFVGLVDKQFYNEAVAIFIGPGRPIENKLLARLSTLEERRRSSFASALRAQGYTSDLPWTESTEARPWQ